MNIKEASDFIEQYCTALGKPADSGAAERLVRVTKDHMFVTRIPLQVTSDSWVVLWVEDQHQYVTDPRALRKILWPDSWDIGESYEEWKN